MIFLGSTAPSGLKSPPWGSSIPLRHTKPGTAPLDEWSTRLWDLYPTTHNTHKKQTSTLPAGLELPTTQEASGRRPTPQTERPLESAILIDGAL
jgi:hypothetical protein